MEKDQFYFYKLFLLIVISFFAGVDLVTWGWIPFIMSSIVAIVLSIGMANLYDKAWDKK